MWYHFRRMTQADQYSLRLYVDPDDGTYIASCPEFPGVSAFGDTGEEALAEARTALELALQVYLDEGWDLPRPELFRAGELPSGEFRLRIPRSMHAQLALRAVQEGVSQNQLVVSYIAAGLARTEGLDARATQALPVER